MGIEIKSEEAEKASYLFDELGFSDSKVYTGDFISWSFHAMAENRRFDAVLGNPPYVRYQYIDSHQQSLAHSLMSHMGLKSTRHLNAWVPFVAASLRLLAPGGRLAMLVPSEVFHIPHAQSLRDMLMEDCRRVLVVDPTDLWVEDILQGVVLLLAEKKESIADESLGLSIFQGARTADLTESAEALFESALVAGKQPRGEKWMRAFLTPSEALLLEDIANRPNIAKFEDVADVDVGIVTGANKFFLVPSHIVEEYGLQPWTHPMFGRSSHIQGVVVTDESLASNGQKGLPNNFLWFDGRPRDEYPESVQAYLALGEAQGLDKRYKCRVRSPWYVVPSVYASSVGMIETVSQFP